AEANAAAFRDGWFRTGDTGYFDGAGFLYVSGRIKDIINRGGAKVAPADVENALTRHPHVIEAAAFALPHSTLGEDVAAAAVLRRRLLPSPARSTPAAALRDRERRGRADEDASFRGPARGGDTDAALGRCVRAGLSDEADSAPCRLSARRAIGCDGASHRDAARRDSRPAGRRRESQRRRIDDCRRNRRKVAARRVHNVARWLEQPRPGALAVQRPAL